MLYWNLAGSGKNAVANAQHVLSQLVQSFRFWYVEITLRGDPLWDY